MSNFSDPQFNDNQLTLKSANFELNETSKKIPKLLKPTVSARDFSVISPSAQQILTTTFKDIFASQPTTPTNLQINVTFPNASLPTVNDLDVTEDFVAQFNEKIGNKSFKIEAYKRLDYMRSLGGLNPHSKEELNVSEARRGLAILAGLKNDEIRMAALKSLQEIVKNDPITKKSGSNLVDAFVSILKEMNRHLMQATLIDVQIEFAKTYAEMVELFIHHSAKGHFNGITQDLKDALTSTTNSLLALNRQNDPKLTFHSRFALEGILRIKDDSTPLVDLLSRFFHLTMAAAAFYLEDALALSVELQKAFKKTNIDIKHSWYEVTIVMRKASAAAFDSEIVLKELLHYIGQHQQQGKKFLYEANRILTDITLHGSTLAIRRRAFEGGQAVGVKLPGLVHFADYKGILIPRNRKTHLNKPLKHYFPMVDTSPILRFGFPHKKSRNGFVRASCLLNLMKIAYKSPDSDIRLLARTTIKERIKTEESTLVKEIFKKEFPDTIPTDKRQLKKWVKESGAYALTNKKRDRVNALESKPESLNDLSIARSSKRKLTDNATLTTKSLAKSPSLKASEVNINDYRTSPESPEPELKDKNEFLENVVKKVDSEKLLNALRNSSGMAKIATRVLAVDKNTIQKLQSENIKQTRSESSNNS